MSLSTHPTRRYLAEWANPPAWTRYSEVHLSVYNLSLTATLNHVTNTLGMGGVFHAGVEVYWLEWSYGFIPQGTGVYPVKPKQSTLGSFHSSVSLGHTRLSPWQVFEILHDMKQEWQGPEYQIFNHNCVCFCAEFSQRLGVQPPPEWVDSLAKVGDSYLGWMIAEEDPADAVDIDNDDMDHIWELAEEFVLSSLVFECWVDEVCHARELKVAPVNAAAKLEPASANVKSHGDVSNQTRRQSFLRRTSLSACSTPVCLPSGREIGVLHSGGGDYQGDIDAPGQLVQRLKALKSHTRDVEQSWRLVPGYEDPRPSRQASQKPPLEVIHSSRKSEKKFQKLMRRENKCTDPELQGMLERLRGLRGYAMERRERAWEAALDSQPTPTIQDVLHPKDSPPKAGGAHLAYTADGNHVEIATVLQLRKIGICKAP
eukprot:gnl/MRDRNA2_/MRDRNA2_18503_c0_seq1.p1 gnl/MRDRNA2_/MRDRNA2_18503_c0~~gnl/MRDRNA2_/MRDRNA2_18503_c0_seq1.p1  ORF type:complete len:428 (-),score=52.32 gnl/MRDRNA2_/MRDRNA2_18503_c0_seq1:108-1391(-)